MAVEVGGVADLAGFGVDVVAVVYASVLLIKVFELVFGLYEFAGLFVGDPHKAVLVDIYGVVAVGVGEIYVAHGSGIEVWVATSPAGEVTGVGLHGYGMSESVKDIFLPHGEDVCIAREGEVVVEHEVF